MAGLEYDVEMFCGRRTEATHKPNSGDIYSPSPRLYTVGRTHEEGAVGESGQ